MVLISQLNLPIDEYEKLELSEKVKSSIYSDGKTANIGHILFAVSINEEGHKRGTLLVNALGKTLQAKLSYRNGLYCLKDQYKFTNFLIARLRKTKINKSFIDTIVDKCCRILVK